MNSQIKKIKEKNIFKNILLFFFCISAIFSGELDTTIPSYILLSAIFFLTFYQIRFSLSEVIVFFFFLLFLSITCVNSNSILSTLINIKWFFGIIVLLIFSKIDYVRLYFFKFLSSQKIYFFFLIVLFLEAILINLIFDPYQLYGEEHLSSNLGFYNRPLGFSGNSSSTATLITAWYYSLNFKDRAYTKLKFLFYTFSIIVLMSSTGFIIYFIAIFLKIFLKNKNFFKKAIQYLLYTILLFILFLILSKNFFQKLSLDYILNVVEIKLFSDFETLLSENLLINLFGNGLLFDIPINGSDFAWFNLIFAHGILGFLLYFLLIFTFSRKKNWIQNILPITILFIGNFHYSALFTLSGSFLFSKLIMSNERNFNYEN